jgi:hypothetical protein
LPSTHAPCSTWNSCNGVEYLFHVERDPAQMRMAASTRIGAKRSWRYRRRRPWRVLLLTGVALSARYAQILGVTQMIRNGDVASREECSTWNMVAVVCINMLGTPSLRYLAFLENFRLCKQLILYDHPCERHVPRRRVQDARAILKPPRYHRGRRYSQISGRIRNCCRMGDVPRGTTAKRE